jgi:hypothetical protein
MLVRASAAKFIGHLDKARGAGCSAHQPAAADRLAPGHPAALPAAARYYAAAGTTVKQVKRKK